MPWIPVDTEVTFGIAKWHTRKSSMYARVLHLGSQWLVLTILPLLIAPHIVSRTIFPTMAFGYSPVYAEIFPSKRFGLSMCGPEISGQFLQKQWGKLGDEGDGNAVTPGGVTAVLSR